MCIVMLTLPVFNYHLEDNFSCDFMNGNISDKVFFDIII